MNEPLQVKWVSVPKSAKMVWQCGDQSLWRFERLGKPRYWLRVDEANTGEHMSLADAAEYIYLTGGYVTAPRSLWDTNGIPVELLAEMHRLG